MLAICDELDAGLDRAHEVDLGAVMTLSSRQCCEGARPPSAGGCGRSKGPGRVGSAPAAGRARGPDPCRLPGYHLPAAHRGVPAAGAHRPIAAPLAGDPRRPGRGGDRTRGRAADPRRRQPPHPRRPCRRPGPARPVGHRPAVADLLPPPAGLARPHRWEHLRPRLDRLERLLFEADWKAAQDALGRDPPPHELDRTPSQRRADALVLMAERSAVLPNDGRRGQPLFTILIDYKSGSAANAASATCSRRSSWPPTASAPTRTARPRFRRARGRPHRSAGKRRPDQPGERRTPLPVPQPQEGQPTPTPTPGGRRGLSGGRQSGDGLRGPGAGGRAPLSARCYRCCASCGPTSPWRSSPRSTRRAIRRDFAISPCTSTDAASAWPGGGSLPPSSPAEALRRRPRDLLVQRSQGTARRRSSNARRLRDGVPDPRPRLRGGPGRRVPLHMRHGLVITSFHFGRLVRH